MHVLKSYRGTAKPEERGIKKKVWCFVNAVEWRGDFQDIRFVKVKQTEMGWGLTERPENREWTYHTEDEQAFWFLPSSAFNAAFSLASLHLFYYSLFFFFFAFLNSFVRGHINGFWFTVAFLNAGKKENCSRVLRDALVPVSWEPGFEVSKGRCRRPQGGLMGTVGEETGWIERKIFVYKFWFYLSYTVNERFDSDFSFLPLLLMKTGEVCRLSAAQPVLVSGKTRRSSSFRCLLLAWSGRTDP